MTRFNKSAWVKQELAKFTATNYAQLRASHEQTLTLSKQYGIDTSESGVPDLLAAADAKFSA